MPAAQIRVLFRQLPYLRQLDLLRELKESICRDPLPPDRAAQFKEIRAESANST